MITAEQLNDVANKFSIRMSGPTDVIEFFIYCSGKSGSKSLAKSFQKMNKAALHIHSNEALRIRVNSGIKYSVNDVIAYCSSFKRVFVIEAYRNPVERKISAVFQNAPFRVISGMSDKELIQFVSEKFQISEEYNSFEEWGIDIYDYPFNKESGYSVIEKSNITYILLRFDRIDTWESIINSILNRTDFQFISDNVTSQKNIADKYKFIKENWEISKEYIEAIYNNIRWKKVMHYFMTDQEYDNYFKAYGGPS